MINDTWDCNLCKHNNGRSCSKYYIIPIDNCGEKDFEYIYICAVV